MNTVFPSRPGQRGRKSGRRAVAYLSIQFPSAVEHYIPDEIAELRGRGVEVVACSVRAEENQGLPGDGQAIPSETLRLLPLRWKVALRATWRCLQRRRDLSPFLRRILLEGAETTSQRIRALAHTWLGVYFAERLRGAAVAHIHVHHGYFAAWVGMVAARLLEARFSMTLHGSDLLLHGTYLDAKLAACTFCVTVSDFNRGFLLNKYPQVDPAKILTIHLGVDVPPMRVRRRDATAPIQLLSVGRLHAVKDFPFLLRALGEWKQAGSDFQLKIAGDGPERGQLERVIKELRLERNVELLGRIEHTGLGDLYDACDVVVLTSRSEGIPLTLMEAMAHAKTVLAPRITGIPELVEDGIAGHLYEPGSREDFLRKLDFIGHTFQYVTTGRAARQYVAEHFERGQQLRRFADTFLWQSCALRADDIYEDPVLQQVQLSI